MKSRIIDKCIINLRRYITDFFRTSDYTVDISYIMIDDISPGVKITITEKSLNNNYFYLCLLFYIRFDLNNGDIYYIPFGEKREIKYYNSDILAFVLSVLLNYDG